MDLPLWVTVAWGLAAATASARVAVRRRKIIFDKLRDPMRREGRARREGRTNGNTRSPPRGEEETRTSTRQKELLDSLWKDFFVFLPALAPSTPFFCLSTTLERGREIS